MSEPLPSDDWFVGADGGGTKTEVVILNARGRSVGQAVGGPANPLRIGYRRAAAHLTEAVRTALAAAAGGAERVRALCVGLAGVGSPARARRMEKLLQAAWPHCRIELCTDLELALACFPVRLPVIVLVAGTGAVAVGRIPGRPLARVGGWGPWFDDEGSATDTGRRALAAIARAWDGRGPATRLEQDSLEALGARDWEQALARVSRRPYDAFAQLYPAIRRAATAGDRVARRLLDQTMRDLAELVEALVARLGLERSRFGVGFQGGLLVHDRQLVTRLRQRLRDRWPRIAFLEPAYSPAVAAARRARERGSRPPRSS